MYAGVQLLVAIVALSRQKRPFEVKQSLSLVLPSLLLLVWPAATVRSNSYSAHLLRLTIAPLGQLRIQSFRNFANL